MASSQRVERTVFSREHELSVANDRILFDSPFFARDGLAVPTEHNASADPSHRLVNVMSPVVV